MNVAILEIMNYKKQFQKTVSANLLVLQLFCALKLQMQHSHTPLNWSHDGRVYGK